jgi:hypothetical protein
MVEEIILQSRNPAALPPPPIGKARKLTAEYPGRSIRAQSATRYRLFNGQFIEVQHRNAKNNADKKIIFAVGFLAKKTKIRTELQWLWFYLSVASLMGAFVGYFILDQDSVAAGSATAAIILLAIFGFSAKKYSVFFSEHALAPLVVIARSGKHEAELHAMVDELSLAIKNNPLSKYVNPLAEETKLLREFCEKGFFSEQEYLQLREKIFNKYPKNKN